MKNLSISRLALIAALILPAAAQAQGDEPPHGANQSVRIEFERLDLTGSYGTFDTLSVEYKAVMDDTTVVVTPQLGWRSNGGGDDKAVRVSADIYHNFSDTVSTRTFASLSENEPVFARFEIGQDLTLKVAHSTTVTGGVRYAQYFNDRDVMFYSLGARQYFRGGSVAYRAMLVDPDNHSAFVSHLLNLSVNDPEGRGKTQMWLSAGGTAIERQALNGDFTGTDYAGMLKRFQPLTDDLDVVISAGLTSYDRPTGRSLGNSVGIGLQLGLD
jgi:YaiO family outer membrane protein